MRGAPTLILGLILLGACSRGTDEALILREIEVAKSDALPEQRLAAARAVLAAVREPETVAKSMRGALLVALGIEAWLLGQQGDFEGLARGKARHRELARAYVARDPLDFECRGHLAQLLAEDHDMAGAWAILLAAQDPETHGEQALWVRAASLVHAHHVEWNDQAGELKSLPPYAELVRRARERRESSNPADPIVLEWLAQECVLRLRSGGRAEAERLLLRAESISAGSLAVVRMRDMLGKKLDLPPPGGSPR